MQVIETLKKMPPNAKAILRDVAILCLVSFIGGFIGGFAGAFLDLSTHQERATEESIIVICYITGYVIIGLRKNKQLWRHLFTVTIVYWLCNLISIVFGLTFAHWVRSLRVLLVFMGIGGGIACLLHKWFPLRAEIKDAGCQNAPGSRRLDN